MHSLSTIVYERMGGVFGTGLFGTALTAASAYILPFLAVAGFLCMVAGFLTLIERKVSADIQNRIGPNRVGPYGLLQVASDGIKLLLKEDIIPAAADRNLFRLAPYIVFTAMLLAGVAIPFGGGFIVADLNIGLVYILAAGSLAVVGFLMSGWASNNKWALLGGIRSAAQIISYEIPAAISLLSVVLIAGSFSMQEIVARQGLYPWEWFIFHNPFTFISFFVFFVSSLAEINRLPFDFPEAESELVSGYNVEYSGMRFAFFFLAEFGNIFIAASIATAVFLGGGNIGLDPYKSSLLKQMVMVFVFLSKAGMLCLVTIWVRWTLPRLRIDHMMSLCWKYLIPISIACLMMTAVWMLVFEGGGLLKGLQGI